MNSTGSACRGDGGGSCCTSAFLSSSNTKQSSEIYNYLLCCRRGSSAAFTSESEPSVLSWGLDLGCSVSGGPWFSFNVVSIKVFGGRSFVLQQFFSLQIQNHEDKRTSLQSPGSLGAVSHSAEANGGRPSSSSDDPPLHHTHVLPSGCHQGAVVAQEAHIGHVTAVAAVNVSGCLKRKTRETSVNVLWLLCQSRAPTLTLNCEQGNVRRWTFPKSSPVARRLLSLVLHTALMSVPSEPSGHRPEEKGEGTE